MGNRVMRMNVDGRRRKGICGGKSDEDVCGREEKERNMWGKRDEDVCGREEKERNMWGIE